MNNKSINEDIRDFIPTEEDVKKLEVILVDILKIEPKPYQDRISMSYKNNKFVPVTFNTYLRRLITTIRFELYKSKTRAVKSDVIKSLDEVYKASDLLYKRLGIMPEDETEETISSKADFYLSMEGYYDYYKIEFREECKKFCNAIEKAKKKAEEELNRKGRVPDLDIRIEAATDLAVYFKKVGIPLKKTTESKYEQCLKELFKFCKFNYNNIDLALPHREDNKRIILEAINCSKDESRLNSLVFNRFLGI